MAELVEIVEMPQGGNENRGYESSPFLYPDAAFIFSQQSEVELLDKSYGVGSSNEICTIELDEGKIDEFANDYRAETCVSYSNAIGNEFCKETVKNDSTLLRNEDESRCKSNRKRKTRRKMPKGVIIDLSKDIYDTSHNGLTINFISTHKLVTKTKLITVSKYEFFYQMQQKESCIKKFLDSFKIL